MSEVTCPDCNGTGQCSACHGVGSFSAGGAGDRTPCPECKGVGACPTCGGRQEVESDPPCCGG